MTKLAGWLGCWVVGSGLGVSLCSCTDKPARCSDDSQCEENYGCDLGICHLVCHEPNQCPDGTVCVWAKSFGYCRKICHSGSECGDGEKCLGGSCTPLSGHDAGDGERPDEFLTNDDLKPDGFDAVEGALVEDSGNGGDEPQAPSCKSARAFLHGNVWPFWYNYRVMCDYQHKMSWLCQQQGRNCDGENQAWQSCDVCNEADGVCIPRTRPGEPGGCCDAGCDEGLCCEYNGPGPPDEKTCFFGYWRSCCTYCDTRKYDYNSMAGHFYGKTWTYLGSWSIHFRDASGNDITSQIVAGSKGEDSDSNDSSSDALGFFGCYQLPTGSAVTIKVSLHDWDGNPAEKPQDYVEATITPEPGKHYVWGPKGLAEWNTWDRGPCVGPPGDIASRLGDIRCDSSQ